MENPDGQSVLKMGVNNIKMAVILCAEPAVFYSNLYIGLLCKYRSSLCSLAMIPEHFRRQKAAEAIPVLLCRFLGLSLIS